MMPLFFVCTIAVLCAVFLPARQYHFPNLAFRIIVVCIGLLLLTGIVLPLLKTTRHRAFGIQRGTQIRGIHQACIIFAQSNNDCYPGFDREGAFELDHAFRVGGPQVAPYDHPSHPAWRFRRLLEDNIFDGQYMISPGEMKSVWSAGSVSTDNYSYAMLSIADIDDHRVKEWRITKSNQAPVLGDRLISTAAGGARSVHTRPDAAEAVDWKGAIAWNDNHVTFEPDFVVDTIYDQQHNADDNLFAPTTGDAYMVYDQP